MTWNHHRMQYGGSAPATPGFNALGQEWTLVSQPVGGCVCLALLGHGQAANSVGRRALPAASIPAPESALRSRPRVALSSAPVIPEWTQHPLAVNAFPANGDNPLNFVSHSRGSFQTSDCHDSSPPFRGSMSNTNRPEGVPVGIPILASGCSVHHLATCAGWVVASLNPC